MKIAFFASNCVPFLDNTVDQIALGGTESACVYMARSLGQLGADVTVYTSHSESHRFGPVVYKPVSALEKDAQSAVYDVFVGIRDWIPLLTAFQSRLRYYWFGDSYNIFFNYGLGDIRVHGSIDRIFAVSRWHAETIARGSGTPIQKFYITRNGFWPEYFRGSVEREPLKFIYSSTPFRGLDVLLAMWPRLRAHYSNASLHLYSSLRGYGMGSLLQTHPELERQTHQPGVFSHESVTQKELAVAMQSATALLYPCTFEETSCITAIEAQAAGTPVVTTDLAALKETIRQDETGHLIQGDPKSAEYQEQFIEKTIALVDNKSLWQAMSEAGRKRAWEVFPWPSIASEWLQFFERELKASEYPSNQCVSYCSK